MSEGRSEFPQSGIQNVGAMTCGPHPGTDGGRRTPLSVRDVLRVCLPRVADSGKSILRFRITCARKYVSHLAERCHLVGMELRGSHQEWTDRQRRKTGALTFSVGQGGHFGGRTGARPRGGFDPRRAGRRRASTCQDEQPDQRKTNRTGGHARPRCKGGAGGQGRSSQLFGGRQRSCVFPLEHTFVNSLRLPHSGGSIFWRASRA
jgi:hypothetical protein